ncbi:LPXTG cell wall anchor domain-containing protein [Candidatus Saccharibacteria bacterium]|nr:LPXTG cell wall anchor domain-containing protein [Candidatus Saccharibacteria bacterium]
MNKFVSLAALVVLPVLGVLFSSPVFATSPGQLAGGDLYQVRNVSKNTGYANSVAATCDEVVKFNFKLSNTEYGMLYGVKVSATLQNGSATASATNSSNEAVSVSDTASVSLDKGSLSYVPGTTQLFTVDGQLIRNLGDGVTTSGVDAGNLAGSTREFVQFQAKVNCPEAPKNIEVCELSTKNIITIDEKAFDAAKHSKNLADCASKPPVSGEIVVCETATKKIVTIKENEFNDSKYTKDLSKCAAPVVVTETPSELPQTGATSVVAIVASLMAAAAGYVVTARKNLLG